MITLASNSQTRKTILKNAGVVVKCISARIDEESIRESMLAQKSKARDIADCLAEAKAQKVSRQTAGWVLGADQVLDFAGQIFSKPESKSDLAAQLEALSGKDHDLYSAAVIYKDCAPIWRFVGVARMSMRELTPTFISDYVQSEFESVKSCVGGYQIEGKGVQLFSKIQGDYFTVLGLPLFNVLDFFRAQGVLQK